jgi:quinol monooxygenase YgiN
MTVIAVADMFGIAAARDELMALMGRLGREAASHPGCTRYTFAATLADPDQFVLLSEWEDQKALDAHFRSQAFSEFQFALDGLLARPSELTVYTADAAIRPLNSRPMDPRDAD